MTAAALVEVLGEQLPGRGTVVTPGARTAEALRARGLDVVQAQPDAVEGGRLDAVVLLEDEMSIAGDHAESLLAAAGRVLRPGGVFAWTSPNAIHARVAATEGDGDGHAPRAWSAAEAVRMAGLAGLKVDFVAAPGAAARLAGRPWAGAADAALDQTPGLLDAGPRLLLAGRTAPDPGTRSARFYGALPLKIVAAAAICQDGHGRLLCVNDIFKGRWTIPGGIVDAGESPKSAAARECREEAGVPVETDELLGVFILGLADRVLLTYRATATELIEHPTPLHPHEISDVAWLDLDDAMTRFAPATRFHVSKSLDVPRRHLGGVSAGAQAPWQRLYF